RSPAPHFSLAPLTRRFGVTTRTTQVHIRDGGFVLTELGNRALRTVLIREKRAVSERTSNGADDAARDVNGGVGYAFENCGVGVGSVGGSRGRWVVMTV